LFAAFANAGLDPPSLDGAEGRCAKLLLRDNDAELVAQCWGEYLTGRYGDAYDQGVLSFSHLTTKRRFANWLMAKAGQSTPPARTNGRLHAGPEMVAAYFRKRAAKNGHDTNTGRSGLGDETALAGLPGVIRIGGDGPGTR